MSVEPGNANPPDPPIDPESTQPPINPAASDRLARESLGTATGPRQIGPYRILEPLGEGGMGTVYKAEQRHPIQRMVALKLIKAGFDSQEVLARFESERQALARMDHPHIAKVLDAGRDDLARPYFVMEYVPGLPIIRFADDNRLTMRQRLDLFVQVCDAIAHAHSKSILHRDIKSSNVLAYLSDGKPTVKVIDFGIAKALTGDRLTDRTFNTDRGQAIGTYESMSPEQAIGSPDIDTRTDVYSLGVLLYELLTGAKPFASGTFADAADLEIRRIIREVEPPRPSTRLSLMGDAGTQIALARHEKLEALTRQLRSELEWIPLMAMRKERARRYATPLQMADDIRNYLEGRPLIAGPESRAYRLSKFAGRHRAALAAALLFCILITGGTGLYIRGIQLEQSKTESERKKTLDALTAEARALKRAKAINAFVAEALQSSDPQAGGRQDTTIAQAMANATAKIESGAFRDDPETEAGLRETIATVLQNNGRAAAAEPLFVQALEMRRSLFKGDHPDVASSLACLGSVRQALGHSDQAEPLFAEALAMRRRLFAGDHSTVASSLSSLASVQLELGRDVQAKALYVESLAMYRRLFAGDHPDIARGLNNLAAAEQQSNRLPEANALLGEALAMRRRLFKGDHPDLAASLSNLASLWQYMDRHAEAEPLLVEALAMDRRLYAGDHPDVATCLNNLASVRQNLGRSTQAEPLFVEALAMRRRLFKGDHPDVATTLNNLAYVLRSQGRSKEAEPLFIEALAMNRRLFAPDHPDVANSVANLALLYKSQGQFDKAEPLFRELLAVYEKIKGPDASVTRHVAQDFAVTLDAVNKHDEAEAIRAKYKVAIPATRPG